MIDIILRYREAFLDGLIVTLKLCLTIWSLGLFVGGLVGVLETKWRIVGILSRSLAFVISGIPVLVFLFWLHYPVQALAGVVIDPFYTAALTLTIVNVFAVAGIVRHGIDELPSQYIETARVCGMPKSRILWRIQLPMVLRYIIPPLLQTQVNMLHLTLFASLISVDEIFRMAQRVNAVVYRPVEVYSALGIFFLIVCLPINGMALYLQNRFSRDISEK
jgi:polar amino acid transport system permease protein